MKPFCVVVASAALLCTVASAQPAKPLASGAVAARGASLQSLVPRGWKIEKRVSGDLNRDAKPDAVLVLVESGAPSADAQNEESRARVLVVALKSGTMWRRAAFNADLLLGTRDGGAFYGAMGTPVNVSVQNGVLNVNQASGSRETTETTYRFRFDARQNGFFLIGLERIDRDRLSGDARNTSTNYLTGVQQTVTFKGAGKRGARQTARVSRKLRAMESVKAQERFGS